MASRGKRNPTQDGMLQILRGAKAVPNALVRRCLVDLQQKKKTVLERRRTTEQKMAKYFEHAGGVVKPGNDPKQAQSLDALLDIHKKLAKQKILPPSAAGGLGGVLAGEITATVVPPFDFDQVIPTRLAGNSATLDASANKNTGAISVSAITATQKGFNGGGMFATVGIYFHPFGSGTLTVSAKPKFSFERWTNSLRDSDLVRSFGSGGLTIFGVDVASQTSGGVGTIVSGANTNFKLWDENQTGQISLDFGFDIEAPTSVTLDVNHNLVYMLFVEANAFVEGVGWPGSLAGAQLSVTVPSIAFDFRMQQVLQQ
ncbi:MAG TPA: hypothetical protein VET48_11690 [Steroidobacteraceae bacterium]|nr:hypothetical protein [Steroidobacteraceae bacterium]